MLPKTHRLSRTQLKPSSPSRFVSTPYFSLKFWKNDVGHNRFGFIISKKVDKRAVFRNSLKRKMMTVVGALPVQGNDYLFYMKKPALEATKDELETVISSRLTVARLASKRVGTQSLSSQSTGLS